MPCYVSESADRRPQPRHRLAAAQLLVVAGDVDAVLDAYFRQCAVLVTARDLAVMAATLANGGVNPVTGEQVISPHVGGAHAVGDDEFGHVRLCRRMDLPRRHSGQERRRRRHRRGAAVADRARHLFAAARQPRQQRARPEICEALSSRFELHMLNRSADVRTCIIADYDIFGISSRRSRQPHEQQILDERHDDIRVIELVGALNFAAIDYVTRRLAGEPPNAPLLILDFRRVPDVTAAGRASCWARTSTILGNAGVTAILSGLEATSRRCGCGLRALSPRATAAAFRAARRAIEWAEDQVIYRYGGFTSRRRPRISASRRCSRASRPTRSRPGRTVDPRAAIKPASGSSAPARPPTRCSSCRAAWSA